MFDTMTLTKILGGLCGTWLVFLAGRLLSPSSSITQPQATVMTSITQPM